LARAHSIVAHSLARNRYKKTVHTGAIISIAAEVNIIATMAIRRKPKQCDFGLISALFFLYNNKAASFCPRTDGVRPTFGPFDYYSTAVVKSASIDSMERQESEPFWHRQTTESSYHIYHPPPQKSSIGSWNDICPSIWKPKDNKDVTITWTVLDSPHEVAQEMIRQCSSSLSPDKTADLALSLADSLKVFRDFCQEHLTDDCERVMKARIVATRGPSGTKCPQWHVDHVPLRWIQSMMGPGCEFVTSQKGINWNVINGLEDDDNLNSIEDRNQALVDDTVASIYSAKEQEAILLVGKRWDEYVREGIASLQPAVHKSPSVPIWQGRVLLTQDV
jgi:hypothetical protein